MMASCSHATIFVAEPQAAIIARYLVTAGPLESHLFPRAEAQQRASLRAALLLYAQGQHRLDPARTTADRIIRFSLDDLLHARRAPQ